MNVLMCAPVHYAIDYEINPWMKRKNGIRPDQAMAQWENVRRTLEQLGVNVLTLPQKKGCPDMVFTANAGVVQKKIFIPSRFRFKERQGEESEFIGFFKKRKYAIRDAAKGFFFEGEGDLLPFREMYFGGFGFRSDARAHDRVAEVLKRRLVALELRQPHFYHFDTCFLPLDDQRVLYYPGAFSPSGRKAIERFVEKPIAVTADEAGQFACNGLRVGRRVVLNRASPRLKKVLATNGYEAVETPTSEFMKAGGSVKCLLLKL